MEELLRILEKNARMPIEDIAAMLDKTPEEIAAMMDEAAAIVRTEINSSPTELDEVNRRILHSPAQLA